VEEIRRSYLNDFERCPRRFYYIREGIKVKPALQSINIRQGSFLHSLISGIEEPVYFSEEEEVNKRTVEVVAKVMRELELLPEDVKHEVEYKRNNATGTLDIVSSNGRWFAEMKYTSKPDFYLNSFVAHAQLEWYFFLNPDFEYCYILPIRVPQLKMQELKESVDKYLDRLYVDIMRRPSFYFPKYNPDRSECKWGLKFYRSEFDLGELQWRINFCLKVINYLDKLGKFPQYKANCLSPSECEYMSICESGAISDSLYIIEKEVSHEGTD